MAGITGSVVMRAVVDTLGQVEPASIVAVSSANRAFEASARAYILSAQFRPARVRGRAVRVLIQVPVDFRPTGVQ
jgi:TonB family protein